MSEAHDGRRWVLAALAFGILLVSFYDAVLAPVRYPYAADSASYVEMADTLYHGGRPRVTPWDLEFPDQDRIPQRLFPPGFPLLIAAFVPLTGDATTASLWPGRLAAALVPLLLLLAFRGALRDRSLALLGAFALATPGVIGWQYLAYSDVTALAVAMLALGACASKQVSGTVLASYDAAVSAEILALTHARRLALGSQHFGGLEPQGPNSNWGEWQNHLRLRHCPNPSARC